MEAASGEVMPSMTTLDPINGKGDSLGFSDAVTRYIAPLMIARGFTCTEQSAHIVTFQSPAVALSVIHEPISYEIDIAYSLQSDPWEQYDLRSMLDIAVGIDHQEPVYFQASEPKRVVECVKSIAVYMQKYGESILTGDPVAYRRIDELSRRRNANFTRQVIQAPTRQAAEMAWRCRDYAKARDLYESIENDLTPLEKKRLSYARSHSHRR